MTTGNHSGQARSVRTLGPAVLLGVRFRIRGPETEADLAELNQLARAARYEPIEAVEGIRNRPHPSTFIGPGKCAQIAALLRPTADGILIVGHDLSGGQQRRLTQAIGTRVIDRHGLILQIFAARARSALGKLQVELAQKQYDLSRLVGGWTHLERQRGATMAIGGMGEKQLEIDRRLLRRRITALRKTLRQRLQQAKQTTARRRARVPTIALAGYTNAGKSTLFARLAGCASETSARMFETLDTVSRQIYLGPGKYAVLSDTVGFVKNLPHNLIAAFQSTLQEILTADLLLIVADLGASDFKARLICVEHTIDTIGASQVPRLLVLAKADLAEASTIWQPSRYGRIRCCPVSAVTGLGIEALRVELVSRLFRKEIGPGP